MRRLRRFINIFMRRLGWVRRTGPEQIPKRLDPADLEKALAEARFLFNAHGVSVRALEAGEVPDLPKSATGEEPPAA